jgi:opacity protein-like surface antigen
MKKLTLLLCFISLSVIAFSQDTKIEPIETGSADAFSFKDYRVSVSVNPLLSWFRPDTKNLESAGSKLGIGGGLFGEKNFNKNIAVGIGLYVTQMGGKIKYDSLRPTTTNTTFNNVEYTYKTRYVDIPVMMRLRTDEFGYNRVYFEAGLGLSFLWKARADVDPEIFSNDRGGSQDRKINDERGDFVGANSVVEDDDMIFIRVPLNIGAGWEYALSTNTVAFAGIRYSAGLFDAMRATDTKAYNSYIGLNLGVMF